MADNVKSKSMDSDKAALGRKLLNKHQRSKTARGNTNGKSYTDNNIEETNTSLSNNAINLNILKAENESTDYITSQLVTKQSETQQDLQTVMPIQQYFNNPIEHSTPAEGELSFFDFARVTIDDPELKHNELYNIQKNRAFKLSETNIQSFDVVNTQETEQRCKEKLPVSNVADISPSYDDSHYIPSKSRKDILDAEHQLAIDSLRSQLQAQILTNSHLLGENSQLQGELQHARILCTHHSDQIIELRQHVESSEARLAECQRQVESSRRLAEELQAKGKEEELLLSSARKERDAALQDSSELLEKLGHAQKDGQRVKQVIGQLREQLDMANIRIQQLSTTNDNHNASIEHIAANDASKEKQLYLEKQLADMEVVLEAVRSERDATAQQYQLYNSQLNEQMAALQAEVLILRKNNEQLVGRERDLVAHIGDMERLLQCNSNHKPADMQTATVSDHADCTGVKDGDGHDVVTVRSELDQIRQQCNQLQERLQETCSERDEALRELQQLHSTAHELEALRNTQQVDRIAQAKLLEEIRSDKVAASRAIEQNLTLKMQVAEMESAYLSVTQDKVAPLTDQLATAKHQLQGHERNLRILHDAVEVKDRELAQLRVYEVQVTQLTNRLRHYETHGHGVPSIQAELRQVKQENEYLQHKLQRYVLPTEHNGECDDHDHNAGDGDENKCSHHHDHEVAVDIKDEDQLQQEIFHLKQQLDEMRQAHADLAMVQEEEQEEIATAQENDISTATANCDDEVHTLTRRLSKAKATQQLEHKFTRTMAELAALNDEKQRLEHLVLQLQGETETIGEYVALYQRQRSLLAQRTASREAQLRQLQLRLGELVRTLEDGRGSGGHSEGSRQINEKVVELLQEISKSNSDLMQHSMEGEVVGEELIEGGVSMASAVACGRGCAWCQGKLMTV